MTISECGGQDSARAAARNAVRQGLCALTVWQPLMATTDKRTCISGVNIHQSAPPPSLVVHSVCERPKLQWAVVNNLGGVSSNLADRAARAAAQSNKLFFKINLNGTDFKIRYLGAFRPLLYRYFVAS